MLLDAPCLGLGVVRRKPDILLNLKDENLDVNQMVKDLREYKGKSSTSCPSVGSWLNSFACMDIPAGKTI